MAIECYNIDMALQKYIKFFQIWGYENKKFQGNRAEIFHFVPYARCRVEKGACNSRKVAYSTQVHV
ncbi:hypothetical protein [uncultured Parabacteroides sp.]|jgi:hypothetical protein|uniref:hypothetical protein n=1 Tax=uncultured Parabacteroides sp. TaxID=512312 RepID=UPI0028055BDC|nr:hypothetical protein [uncultured Parabacteroides sp.]MBD9166947.1 hypothetical protein [Parabacteroides johnsonii]